MQTEGITQQKACKKVIKLRGYNFIMGNEVLGLIRSGETKTLVNQCNTQFQMPYCFIHLPDGYDLLAPAGRCCSKQLTYFSCNGHSVVAM